MSAKTASSQLLYDTIIEVIDPSAGRLIVTRRFDTVMGGYSIRDGYIAGYAEDDDGVPRVPVMKLRFAGYDQKNPSRKRR